MVQNLIEKGAHNYAKDDEQWTPLLYHIVVKQILSISKGANKNAKEKDAKIPYDIACSWKYEDKSQREIIKEPRK